MRGGDKWKGEPAEGGYDRRNLYTGVLDEKGHDGGSVRVRLSRAAMAEVTALVQSRVMPDYKTAQDFIRDAVVHRLRDVGWLLVQPDMVERAEKLATFSAAEQLVQELDESKGRVKLAAKLVVMLDSLEDPDEIRATMDKLQGMIPNLPAPHRGEMTSRLRAFRLRASKITS